MRHLTIDTSNRRRFSTFATDPCSGCWLGYTTNKSLVFDFKGPCLDGSINLALGPHCTPEIRERKMVSLFRHLQRVCSTSGGALNSHSMSSSALTIKPQVKTHIRQAIFQGLSDPNRKIRSLCVSILALVVLLVL
jgi:hypothetical protein